MPGVSRLDASAIAGGSGVSGWGPGGESPSLHLGRLAHSLRNRRWIHPRRAYSFHTTSMLTREERGYQ